MMGSSMYSIDEFAALEIMCRDRATLAKKEIEHWRAETKYWTAEAEEWRRFRESKEVECLEA